MKGGEPESIVSYAEVHSCAQTTDHEMILAGCGELMATKGSLDCSDRSDRPCTWYTQSKNIERFE